VNNAGILRDRMLVSMSESDWDAVVRVHLKGTFAPTHHAAEHWRERHKAGEAVDARVVNTTSPSGIYGNVGQANYGAAKAGIAAFSQVCALELGRLGVTSNCLAPVAMTRLVMPLMGGEEAIPEETKEALSPRWIAAVATWLASPEARDITGRTFEVRGDMVSVAEGWHAGPAGHNSGVPTEVGKVMADLVGKARPNSDLNGADAPDRYTVGS
jgi:NAD(P)-dependent dehydrogenase (short-subunit alcohol dehydrogenase family)